MQKDPNFPAMKWHPKTGESRVFTAAEDVPEGWIDTHPNNVIAKDAPAPDELPLTKKQIKTELDAAGVTYPPTAGAKALYELLSDSLKTFCAENEIPYEADMSVLTLLELVKKPE